MQKPMRKRLEERLAKIYPAEILWGSVGAVIGFLILRFRPSLGFIAFVMWVGGGTLLLLAFTVAIREMRGRDNLPRDVMFVDPRFADRKLTLEERLAYQERHRPFRN